VRAASLTLALLLAGPAIAGAQQRDSAAASLQAASLQREVFAYEGARHETGRQAGSGGAACAQLA